MAGEPDQAPGWRHGYHRCSQTAGEVGCLRQPGSPVRQASGSLLCMLWLTVAIAGWRVPLAGTMPPPLPPGAALPAPGPTPQEHEHHTQCLCEPYHGRGSKCNNFPPCCPASRPIDQRIERMSIILLLGYMGLPDTLPQHTTNHALHLSSHLQHTSCAIQGSQHAQPAL